ncbi:hypothetical protein [Actinoplanes sp. NPDC049316]
MWSTVQAAITGGWAETLRLLTILTGFAVLIVVLRSWAGTQISPLLQVMQ